MDNKQAEIAIKHLLDTYVNELVMLEPATNINDLRIQVEQLEERIDDLQTVKEEIKLLDDMLSIVELGTLADTLITDFDKLRIKYQAEYEKRQRTNPIRAAEAFLEFAYPQIAEKIPELIDATLIEVVGDKYNWLDSLTLLANLFRQKGGSFNKRIADYFLLQGNSIKINSLHTKFKAETIATSFNRLQEVFPDIKMY